MKKIILSFLFAVSCLVATAQYQKLMDFTGTANGRGPWGTFVSDGTYLYSMTELGGTNSVGTVFKIKKDGTGYLKLRDFAIDNNGYIPRGSFYYDNVDLYGVPYDGGINDAGVIIKMKTDGSAFQKMIDFSGPSGYNPEVAGALVFDGTYLYGTATWGGLAGGGTIYRVKKDGTGFEVITNFDGVAKGSRPFGAVYYDNGFLYGMTTAGGANDSGTIYKVSTDGSVFTKLRDLGGSGSSSRGFGHFISDGTYLYGMSNNGGTKNVGTIFKIKPDGTGYTILHSFTTTDGAFPLGSLISDGKYLYGMATEGGGTGDGTIFRIKTDGGGFGVLYDFLGIFNADGSFARGSLYTDSVFLYGMTNRGGSNDFGIIFRYAIPTEVNEFVPETAGLSVYPNPATDKFYVTLSTGVQDAHADIYNTLGDKVYSTVFTGKEKMIDVNLKPGVYFLRVINGNQTIVREKLVLQ